MCRRGMCPSGRPPLAGSFGSLQCMGASPPACLCLSDCGSSECSTPSTGSSPNLGPRLSSEADQDLQVSQHSFPRTLLSESRTQQKAPKIFQVKRKTFRLWLVLLSEKSKSKMSGNRGFAGPKAERMRRRTFGEDTQQETPDFFFKWLGGSGNRLPPAHLDFNGHAVGRQGRSDGIHLYAFPPFA